MPNVLLSLLPVSARNFKQILLHKIGFECPHNLMISHWTCMSPVCPRHLPKFRGKKPNMRIEMTLFTCRRECGMMGLLHAVAQGNDTVLCLFALRVLTSTPPEVVINKVKDEQHHQPIINGVTTRWGNKPQVNLCRSQNCDPFCRSQYRS